MKLTKLKNYIGDKSYKLFCKNYNARFNTNQDNLQEYFDHLESRSMEYKVIGKAFVWKRSKEGYSYWANVNRKMWRAIDLERQYKRIKETIKDLKDKKTNAINKQKAILTEFAQASKIYKESDYAMKLIKSQVKAVKTNLIALDKSIKRQQDELDRVTKEQKDLQDDSVIYDKGPEY
jgi:DNA repair exonuclease SbcCD ATPase subunit